VNDSELRALVRDAVARHLGGGAMAASEEDATRGRSLTPGVDHPSHAVYVSVVNDTGSCVIEPGVRCNHCNYCKSHGH
jgi:hypothetical protein